MAQGLAGERQRHPAGPCRLSSRLKTTRGGSLVAMKKTFGLALLILVLAACGGSSSTNGNAPSTSAPTTAVTGEASLAGLAFEVHQEPG